jgi:hypothetical protein
MTKLVNRAKVATATTNTGTITLGAAESGYQTFADAGVVDGDVVRYVIEDGTDWEIGTGTYTASGTTLSRTVLESSNADAALNLTGSAVVYVSATDADFREETVGTIASSTLDLSTGNVFSDAPSANVTYVFSNPPATGTAYGFTLNVTPSGTYTVTWPASVDWAGGTAPDAPASGETDVYAFYTQDGGSNWYGFLAGDAMS